MNLSDFYLKYINSSWSDEIEIACCNNNCDRKDKLKKGSAVNNIKRNGKFICRSCSYTDDGRDRIAKATSYKRTVDTRKKMSDAKIAFYKTDEGKLFKKKLSILTAKGHAVNKYKNTKRSGWYDSNKAGKVFYGSSYELLLCYRLDLNESIKTYQTQIYYEINGRSRCLDFITTDICGKKQVIEVKPNSRLNERANIEQINDSRAYADSIGCPFDICTETYFGMTCKEIRNWADVYLSERGEFDWVSHRKESNNKKAKKHYRKHIAQDKVEVFCEYCQTTHNPLKLTYDKNIARNGKYICEREGGFIAGSRPKKKKENPYASKGKKQCNGPCGQIKPFEEFGLDKAKSDGYATQCKVCRAEKAKGKYKDHGQRHKSA